MDFSKYSEKDLNEITVEIDQISKTRQISPALARIGISANTEIIKRIHDRLNNIPN